MLVYIKQFTIQYARYEHKSILELSVGDALNWTTHKHVVCVTACTRFYENTSRLLHYLCNNNSDVEARVSTSRSCTNSGHTKEWHMRIAVLYTFNLLCSPELSKSLILAFVHSYKNYHPYILSDEIGYKVR